jgi:cytochrome c biogenesis protein CcdA
MAPSKRSQKGVKPGPNFTKNNYRILGIGLVFIVVGFLFLGFGDITVAPILLVLGYCVVIPLGILFPKKKDREPAAGDSGSAD